MKTVLITGVSSGIGQAIAIAFAKEGANLAITYQKNREGAEQTQKAIQHLGRQCKIIQANLSSDSELFQLVPEALTFLGGIDILVNNAGMLTRHTDFLDISIEAFDLIQAVNYRAPFILTQAVARIMKERSHAGSIINICSLSSTLIVSGFAHYEASKAALAMLTKSSASDLAKYNIRVNAISPGLVETNINSRQRETMPDIWEKRCSKIPLQRTGKPGDVVPVALLLASSESAWMTGTIIGVDGGMAVAPYI